LSPSRLSRTGWKPGGERATERFERDYVPWALADFSGYLTADELYDGPFCVLSLVDNRSFKRLDYQVLTHDPTQADLLAFFKRFAARVAERQLTVKAITTDGKNFYPPAITAAFGAIPHQICQFHVLAELTRVVLRAVAHVRKDLAARKPKRRAGRPAPHERAQARAAQRLQAKLNDLYTDRYLFVRRHLTPAQGRQLQRITRGLPHLRTLRQLMHEIYGLFDRRCRTATALAKLTALRRRVKRFTQLGKTLQTLFSATVEKALTFLDDRLLPATSNAVERGNRRHRKMQKSVYRVRTQSHIARRIALDLFRDAQAPDRGKITTWLHQARAAR
jgi:hypothetical protein